MYKLVPNNTRLRIIMCLSQIIPVIIIISSMKETVVKGSNTFSNRFSVMDVLNVEGFMLIL